MERQSTTLEGRRRLVDEIDRKGLMATPANSRYNEAVCEAARKSVLDGGSLVKLGDLGA